MISAIAWPPSGNGELEYVLFTAAEGVTGHCEMSGRSVFHRRAYDWLDGVFGSPTAVA